MSKTSGPDCTPVAVLKNCEPELSCIQAEVFNMCLKDSCFPDCWKISSVIPVLKNVWEKCMARNCCSVSLLSVASKVFEKLINIRLVWSTNVRNVAWRNMVFFLISSVVLGLLNKLQIFKLLYPIKLLGLLIGLGLLELLLFLSDVIKMSI